MPATWKSKTAWREKRDKPQEPKIVDTPPKMVKQHGEGKMLIPTPLEVDALIKKVRKGKLITAGVIRERLASDHGADTTCPMTTGIFIRIAAEAAEEDLAEGRKRVTPYWRVVKPDGSLYDKLPGGASAQAKRLKEEGHEIERGKGKKPPKVKDLEKRLQSL